MNSFLALFNIIWDRSDEFWLKFPNYFTKPIFLLPNTYMRIKYCFWLENPNILGIPNLSGKPRFKAFLELEMIPFKFLYL